MEFKSETIAEYEWEDGENERNGGLNEMVSGASPEIVLLVVERPTMRSERLSKRVREDLKEIR